MGCYLAVGIDKRSAVMLADYAEELVKRIICVYSYYFTFQFRKFYFFSLKKVSEVNPHNDASIKFHFLSLTSMSESSSASMPFTVRRLPFQVISSASETCT